jgi:hypothetical protein
MPMNSWMKRFFLWLMAISLVSFLGLGVTLHLAGPRLFKEAINNYGSVLCGCNIKVKQIKWSLFDPLKISFIKIEFEQEALQLKTAKVKLNVQPEVVIDKHDWNLRINVLVEEGDLVFIQTPNTVLPEPNKPSKSARESIRQLEKFKHLFEHLTLSIVARKFAIRTVLNDKKNYLVKLKTLALNFDGRRQMMGWEFDADLTLPPEILQQEIPFASNGKIVRVPERLEFGNTSLTVMGVPMALSGGLAVQSNAVDLHLKINKANLAMIKANNLLAHWTGLMDCEASLVRAGSFDPWAASAKLSLSQAKGSVELNNENYSLKGPLKLDLSAEANYQANVGLELPKVEWLMELSDLQVSYKGVLEKPTQVPLVSQGQLTFSKGVVLTKAQMQLANIDVSVNGQVDKAKVADLSFDLKPLNLAGLEKLFPFLNEYPLSGQAEFAGRYTGSLLNRDTATIELEKIRLENLRGSLSWKSAEVLLSGPFLINLVGALSATGKDVRKGNIDLKMDLSGMEIRKGTAFSKPAKALLELGIIAKQEQGVLKINKGSLKGPFGNIAIEGTLPVPPVYSTQLKISTEQISLSQLKGWLPSLSEMIPDGFVKAKLQAAGELNLEKVLESRVATTGEVKAWIPKFVIESQEPKGALATKKPALSVEVPGPLLPSSTMLQSLAINTDVKVDLIVWQKMEIKNVRFATKIADGKALGQASIGKILDGSVEFPRFELPLFEIDPTAAFAIKASQVNLGRGLAQFLPPWKDFVEGTIYGEFSGLTKLPSSPSFLKDLQSSGKFKISSGAIKSLPLKGLLEKKLQALPLGKDLFANFTFQNANLAMVSDFLLAKQQLTLHPILIVTPDKHELILEGTVGFDKIAQLSGVLLLAANIKNGLKNGIKNGGNFFEANKDEKGRLVIPLVIEGNVLSPSIGILEATLAQMAQKTINYEKNKLLDKTQRDLSKKVKEVEKDLQKKLEQGVPKTIKDLFK